MKADYKNWVPKGMIYGLFSAAAVLALLFAIAAVLTKEAPVPLKITILVVLGLGAIICGCMAVWMKLLHDRFSYDGKRKMSKQIIEGIAEYVDIQSGGKCLDVGCGSGALAIAVAKRNPTADIIGVDRWGKEYASFNKKLCQSNAEAEGVSNTRFIQGDALQLDFPNESFNAVVSNYVYHNIPSKDRQKILLETLRVLKKGGTFAIHDIFSNAKYGDMKVFVEKLKSMGYESVELIDTTEGKFMMPKEAKWMGLSGSALLVGKK